MSGAADARQIVAAGNDTVELQEADPPPKSLGPHHVAGSTVCTLVSPGTELAGVHGRYGNPPHRLGYSAVFTAERVGNEVRGVAPGDLLFCMGPHRSWQVVDEREAVPVPQDLPPETACIARMMAVSMSTLTTTVARPSDPVVVTGLGLVGNLAAQIFQSAGYSVLGVDPNPRRRSLAEAHGVSRTGKQVPVDDAAIRDHVALGLECAGHEQATLDLLRVVRKRGEVVLVGVPWVERAHVSAHQVFHEIFHRYVVVRSGWEWELPRHDTEYRTGSIFGNLRTALRWLAEGRVDTRGIAVTFNPQDCADAYALVDGGAADALSVVFDWRPGS